jgi:hypothetical protein
MTTVDAATRAMFFMPEYYPLQILLSGAFPENFLSAALGRSVGAAAEESRGGAIINYQTRTRTNWFPNSIRLRRSSGSACHGYRRHRPNPLARHSVIEGHLHRGL